jgi:hypothetical protein
MVRRQATKVTRRAARVATPRRTANVEAGTKLETAERRLELAGRAVAKLARNSMREMAAAANAAGPPMQVIWRTVARAGRNIARDATVAWHELAPAVTPAKPTVAKAGRRPVA